MFSNQTGVWARLLLLLLCSGCAQVSSTGPRLDPAIMSDEMLPGDEISLPDVIAETSALICLPDQQFLTVNDSGQPAVIHQINLQGNVVNTYPLDISNVDWEAMTTDGQRLWIADIGNNSGQRQQLQIHQLQLPLTAPTQISSTLQLRYAQQPQPPVQPYQHDFDAEALAIAGNQLIMFSKNWLSQGTDVYRIQPAIPANAAPLADISQRQSTAVQHQRLEQIARVHPLPGVLTDATFSEQHQVFVVTGYANFQRNMLNMLLYDDYRPFIALLDRQFKLLASMPVAQGGQLEAVCLDQQQMIWLTQEKSKKRPALLWRYGSLSQWLQRLSQKSSQIN